MRLPSNRVLGSKYPPRSSREGGRSRGSPARSMLTGRWWRARHAKFLKIDPLHDLLVHSPLHNAALPILSRYYEGLEPHPYVGDDTSLDAIFKPRRIHENAFEVDITNDHCNGLGGLHGGAACILAEHAAGDGGLKAMHVSLMRGLKAGAVARVSCDAERVSIADASGAACYEATVSPVSLTSRRWRGARP